MSARVSSRLAELFADDRTLLARFADQHDEAAFAALVRRHGGMVLGVCRRAVRDAHLAEDAFQAVFLTLARDPAAAIRSAGVGGWLFGIARRVGLAARRRERRREKYDGRAGADFRTADPVGTDAGRAADWDDLLRVLDEELAALPGECRAALLACFLRGQTQDETARQLGWSLSTLRRRLDRGKELLRARLGRRGVTLPAGLLAGALAAPPASAFPARLVEAAGRAARGEAPALAYRLAAGAVGGSAVGKLTAAAVVLAAGVLVAGTAYPGPAAPLPAPAPAVVRATAAPVPAPSVDWAAVTGRVVFPPGQAVPPPRDLRPGDRLVKDAGHVFAGGRRLFFEDVRIDPGTRGLRDAVVWLRPDSDDLREPFARDRVHPALRAAGPREHTIETAGFQFAPRVVAARAGDTLRFRNTTPSPDNVNYQPDGGAQGNRAFNVLLPPGDGYAPGSPLPPLRGPDRFTSNIHQWMAGRVWAFDHPYFAVTDGEGRFTIPDMPAGRWRLVVWHEVGGFRGGRTKPVGEPVVVAGTGAAADLGELVLDSDRWAERTTRE